MRPIPQTVEAARDICAGTDDDVLGGLQASADRIQEVVPDCVGLSVGWLIQGITFTLVASDEEIAVLDAFQYLEHGPSVEGVEYGQGVQVTSSDLMDEERWRLFAQATAAHAVRSTLTLPLTEGPQVVGSANLYGASDHAFEGHHEELARILGASVSGVVRNADLTFSTRLLAQQTPQLLRDDYTLDLAAGFMAERLGIPPSLARRQIVDAADRAGMPRATFVEAVLRLFL